MNPRSPHTEHVKNSSETTPPLFQIRNVARQVEDHYFKVMDGHKSRVGPVTGFHKLDQLLVGFSPGTLHLLSSRPGMGRTTLMLNIAEHVSVDQAVPTLVFSGQLPSAHVVQRMIFARARQNAYRVVKLGVATDEDGKMQLQKAAEEIANSPLFIEDCFDFSVEALCDIARRYARNQPIGLIAIDQLHLLRSKAPQAHQSHDREIIEIVAEIKSLAKQLQVPILLLTELNRKPERRRKKRGMPYMTDLLHYNLLEGYADTVSLLYRPAYYAETQEEKEAQMNKAEVIVCKSLEGYTGHASLRFDPQFMRFEEEEREFYEPM